MCLLGGSQLFSPISASPSPKEVVFGRIFSFLSFLSFLEFVLRITPLVKGGDGLKFDIKIDGYFWSFTDSLPYLIYLYPYHYPRKKYSNAVLSLSDQ